MVTSILNENPGLSLERVGYQIKNLLRNFQVHKSILTIRIKGFKIYTVSEKINPWVDYYFRDQLSCLWKIGLSLQKIISWCPFPSISTQKTKSQCISFGIFINKRGSLGTQAGIQSGGRWGGEVKSNNLKEQMRNNQMGADVNKQLIWSQFRGPGAN